MSISSPNEPGLTRKVGHFCAAIVHWLSILALATFTARAQFSPGALSKAHQHLDGPTRCAYCHIGGGGSKKFKCTACHQEIAERLAQNRGLHPALVARDRRAGDACIRCHSEHNGKEFVPILWDSNPDDLDHRRTGYPLEGAHARLACRKCHAPEHISASARKTIRVRDLRRTYLGLDRACLSCHRDEHRQQLGAACERCHTVSRWKDVARFDHAGSKFPLVGAHARVACAKCHRPEPSADGGKPVIRYVGMAFAQCQTCHQDPHKGSFAAACASCHNESTWKTVRNVAVAFDHSKTKYPLRGRHADLACEKCHRGADFRTPVAHGSCNACHKDAHSGQFLARADKGECASCHTVEGWKPSTFNLEAHARSAYPLLGRHVQVKCGRCHRPMGQATVYRVKFGMCIDCHQDAHQRQFAGGQYGNLCEKCHTVDHFQPAKFTLARHDKTRFPLSGAHAAVSCGECHKIPPYGPKIAAFHFAKMDCQICHLDPHAAQFTERMRRASVRGPGGCETCHNVNTWHDLPTFDHSTTRFVLTGAHKGVSCEQCHRATPVSVGLLRVNYRETPRACAECHEDPHAGQFRNLTSGSQDCALCHQTGRWRPANFNHDRASFRLTGSHDRVACSGCHTARRESGGRMVLFYKPIPKECSDCHGATTSN